MSFATVGAFLRIDPRREPEVRRGLGAIPGTEPFALDEPGKLGVVIEAVDLATAQALVTGAIRAVPGVLAAFPVYANVETGDATAPLPDPAADPAPEPTPIRHSGQGDPS